MELQQDLARDDPLELGAAQQLEQISPSRRPW